MPDTMVEPTSASARRSFRSMAGATGRVALALCAVLGLGGAAPNAPPPVLDSTPFLRIETGMHEAAINRLLALPREGRLITVSDDKTARAWRLDTLAPDGVIRPPVGPGDDGALYAVAANDNLIFLAGRMPAPDGGYAVNLVRRATLQPIGNLSRGDIEAAALRYLARTEPHRPLGKPRFVDKMLGNFGHIGLIHLMFPRAAIIDARRHPLASTFSCYKQLFGRGVKFSYEQRELGRYGRDYFELLRHMDEVLPGRVHRVRYEDLIADPEAEVRRLLDYCGLPFEPGCLRFYENPRIVQTVSSEQVRRPIYADAVDQWRHYEPWLGPLKEALGPFLLDYPS